MSSSSLQLARRYSEALFGLALERNVMDKIALDMKMIEDIFTSAPEINKAIVALSDSEDSIAPLLDTIIKKASFDKLSANFLKLLVKNRRIKILLESTKIFSSLVEEHKGNLFVTITSAEDLDSGQISLIEKKLSTTFGKNVKAVVKVDEKILGGLIITIGSKMWDASLSGKIIHLHSLSKQAIANF